MKQLKPIKIFSFGVWIVLLIISILNITCATSSPLNPQQTLSPPLGLSAVPHPIGTGILLSYYGANDEEDFDGYNLYISEKENVADITEGNTPFIPEGRAPTIGLSPEEVNTNLLRTYIVKYRNNDLVPLASGTRYFFIMKAHSSKGYVSVPSNESSATAP